MQKTSVHLPIEETFSILPPFVTLYVYNLDQRQNIPEIPLVLFNPFNILHFITILIVNNSKAAQANSYSAHVKTT